MICSFYLYRRSNVTGHLLDLLVTYCKPTVGKMQYYDGSANLFKLKMADDRNNGLEKYNKNKYSLFHSFISQDTFKQWQKKECMICR